MNCCLKLSCRMAWHISCDTLIVWVALSFICLQFSQMTSWMQAIVPTVWAAVDALPFCRTSFSDCWPSLKYPNHLYAAVRTMAMCQLFMLLSLWWCPAHLYREYVHFTLLCTDWVCMPEWMPSSYIWAYWEMETQNYCIICWLLKKYTIFLTTIPWGPSLRSYNHETQLVPSHSKKQTF